MKKEDRISRLQTGLLCAAILTLLAVGVTDGNAADSAANYPTRPIECVLHTGPGSANDLMWRLIGDIIQKEKLLDQPLVVSNRRGAGGAIAFSYVYERKGNPHLILATASSTFLMTPLLEKLPYDYRSFTSIGNWAIDGNVLLVKSDSPFKTMGDLIAEAKKRPKELAQAGGNYTGSDGITYEILQKATGAQWNFVSFKSAGEVLLSILNGATQFAVMNPGEMIDHARAGKVRVLLAVAPNRYPVFKDAPTMQEAGLGIPLVQYRGFVGAPGMPEYARRRIESVFEKVKNNDRLKQFFADLYMQPAWMSSAEKKKFLDEENARYKEWVGLLKK
jgi:putative tricarboxylic transport membrane protein